MHLVFPRVNLTSAAYITVLENTEEEIIDNQVVRMSFFCPSICSCLHLNEMMRHFIQ